MPYTPILATLGYLLSDDGQRVLLVYRNKRSNDAHLGKYNGLGGKLEPQEDVVTGLRREFLEEAGLEIVAPELRGTVSWPGFGKGGEDWFGFVFRIKGFKGKPNLENAEGHLEWVALEDLLQGRLPMWPSDLHFLPLVFDQDPRVFHGAMPFLDGAMLSWSYTR